jgi:hypothetical protein
MNTNSFNPSSGVTHRSPLTNSFLLSNLPTALEEFSTLAGCRFWVIPKMIRVYSS